MTTNKRALTGSTLRDEGAHNVTYSAPLRAHLAPGLSGQTCVPGDKSISHRVLMFGAIAQGETQITGLLEGDDVLRTAAAMRTLGADIEVEAGGDGARVWRVRGISKQDLSKITEPLRLYFGNAGTGARLAMGLIGGLGVPARFDGDTSLRSRPMGRILDPLKAMGLNAHAEDGKLPVTITPKMDEPLKGIPYTLPVASAQVKSAILLAGLHARGQTKIIEPVMSRDHTENMLTAFGVSLDRHSGVSGSDTIGVSGGGQIITLEGGQTLTGTNIVVPGDPSSAAFLIVAALITPDSEIVIEDVLLNPMRTGLIDTLIEMGGDITITQQRNVGGETLGTITARTSTLKGVNVPAERAPSMIDEYPVLCVAAAFADGTTKMNGIGEMRVKESDRIAATQAGLSSNGVKSDSGPDWMSVTGSPRPHGGGHVVTHHDHRIAMAFLTMGCATKQAISIDTGAMIETSFPTFLEIMIDLGANIHNPDDSV